MNKEKRIILIGRSSAGKTTLSQFLNREALRYHKTQTVQVMGRNIIDTPGEYLERMQMRGALMISAADADLIVLVQDATEDGTMFPPAYASTFAKPSIGVITKSDIASPSQITNAEKHLRLAGALDIFIISSVGGTGFAPLLDRLGYANRQGRSIDGQSGA